MSPNEISMICDRLDRIENKLDENIRRQALKVPRSECENHRKSLWEVINGVSRKMWIIVGIGMAVELVILPIVVSIVAWLIMKG